MEIGCLVFEEESGATPHGCTRNGCMEIENEALPRSGVVVTQTIPSICSRGHARKWQPLVLLCPLKPGKSRTKDFRS